MLRIITNLTRTLRILQHLYFLFFSFSFCSICLYIFQYCLVLFTFLLSYPKVHRNNQPEHDRFMISTHVIHDPCCTADRSDHLSNPLLLTDCLTYAFTVSCIVHSCIAYVAFGHRALRHSIYSIHMQQYSLASISSYHPSLNPYSFLLVDIFV